MEKVSSKKKYLAPLVVIMLCAVAMTGAAYAYNTSVQGYGDIEGKYAFIDLYPDESCKTATAKFTGDASSFKVYTQTVKTVDATTGDETSKYNAYVESCDLVFSAFIKINTTLSADKEFILSNCSFVYNAPAGSGTILVDGSTEGQLNTEIKAYEYNQETGKYDSPVSVLKGNTPYKVKITLHVTGDSDDEEKADPLEEENYPFGTYTTSDAAIEAVNAFNKEYSYELTITVGVTEKPAPVPI